MEYNPVAERHDSVDVAFGSSPEPPNPRVGRSVEYVTRLWRDRALLWRWTWRCCVVATLVAFLLPKTWTSIARLMPPDSAGGGGLASLAALAVPSSASSDSMPGLAGGALGDLLGGKNTGALFVGVLRSRTVQDRLIDRLNLRHVYGVPTYEAARLDLTDNTDIVEDRRSGIITITVRDRNPQRARDLATGYVNELDRLMAEVSTSSARRERIFLEQRLVAVKADLDQAAKQLSEYSSKNATLDLTAQAKATLESAAALQGQLIAAQSQLRGLQAIYTENNVRVRALQARIKELQSEMEKVGGSSSAPDTGVDGEQPLYPSIRQLPVVGLTYSDLYRRAKIQEIVYETLTKQYELAKVQEAKEIPTVKVLDPPLVPERKTSPKRLQIMILGLALGFLAGMAWVGASMLWEELDAADPKKLLAQEIGGTVFATISDCKQKLLRSNGAGSHWWRRRSLAPPNHPEE